MGRLKEKLYSFVFFVFGIQIDHQRIQGQTNDK